MEPKKRERIFTMKETMLISEILLAALAYYMLFDAGKSVILIGIGILFPVVAGVMTRKEQDPVRKKILWGVVVATMIPPILYWAYLVLSVMVAELR